MHDRSTRTTKLTAAGLLALVAACSGGCDWSLAFNSGSLDIVEDLICPECDDTPKNPDVDPNSPGTSTGGGGGAAEEPQDEPDEPEVTMGDERAAAIVGGRRWTVDAMTAEIATDHEGRAVVAVSTEVSIAGVEGESTVFVPSQLWPTKPDASPAVFEIGAAVGARQNPSLTIGGKEYLLEFVSSAARVDDTPAGPRVRGVVEAHAVALTAVGKPNAKKQLVRLSFDADAE